MSASTSAIPPAQDSGGQLQQVGSARSPLYLARIAQSATRRSPWATIGAIVGVLLSISLRSLLPITALKTLPPTTVIALVTSLLAVALDRLGLIPPLPRIRRLRQCAEAYRTLEADGLITKGQREREMDLILLKYRP